MRNLKNYIFVLCLIFSLFSFRISTLNAQVSDVHMDASWNIDFFTNHGNLDLDVPDNGFAFRAGINWKLEKYEYLTLGVELGFSQRSIINTLGDSQSEVRFRAIDFSPVLTWEVHKMISTEFGLGFSFYDPALYVDGVSRKLGEGFKNFDVYCTAGFIVDFHAYAAIGSRIRYGFVPALKYEPIGDYGEMDGEQAIINQLTLELFLRIRFYRLKDE